jgi:hypothetical protein
MSDLYEKDFVAWTAEQAELLRAGKLSEMDIDHVAEEIEDMGSDKRSQLTNRLTVLLMHMLKWRYQPEQRSRSWTLTMAEQRARIARLMLRNPSLKSYVLQAMEDGYEPARYAAARETGLDVEVFPIECPWDFAHAMARDLEK